jgi:hypothetical protein
MAGVAKSAIIFVGRGLSFRMEDKTMLDDHEQRITALERNYEKVEIRMGGVENGIGRVESTVLREGQNQTHMLNRILEQHFELKKAAAEQTHDLKKTKSSLVKDIVLGLFGAGGFLVLVFSKFVG